MNDVIKCGDCHTNNPDDHSFCSHCGASLEAVGVLQVSGTKLVQNDVQLFPSAPVIFAAVVLVVAIVGFFYGLSQLSQYNTFMGQLAVGFSQSAASQKVSMQVLTWSSAIVGLICISALIWSFAKKNR